MESRMEKWNLKSVNGLIKYEMWGLWKLVGVSYDFLSSSHSSVHFLNETIRNCFPFVKIVRKSY